MKPNRCLQQHRKPIDELNSKLERPIAWVTGAGGLIGNCLIQTAPRHAPSWTVSAITRDIIDLTDFRNLRRLFQAERPALVIHCAAMSSSPACQANPDLARKLNVEVTSSIADLASEIPFILLSTDLIFDGRKGDYTEADPVNPLSIYAETKADAEAVVLRNPKHTVIRTSLNGGTSPKGNRGFNEELRRAWMEGRTPRLFIDEFRSPIPAKVTARAIWEFTAHQSSGIYHLAGREKLSRWQIGTLIAARWPHLKPKIETESIANHQGLRRPPDSSLNSGKIQKLLSFPLPGLTEWLNSNPDDLF